MNIKPVIEKAGFVVRQASPEILMSGGIILSIAALITACSKMKHTEEVQEELQDELDYIEETEERGTKEYRIASFKAGSKAVFRYLVIFWLPILLEILSILAIWYSHGIMVKRNADLASAFIIMTQQMDKYRERVRNKVGEETENDLFYGLTKSATGETITITDENGKEKKVKQFPKVVEDGAGGPFDRIFDRTNHQFKTVPGANLMYLNGVYNAMRYRLMDRATKHSDGWLTLNEVYNELGFESTEAGFNWGWTYSRDEVIPDIDFGIQNCSDMIVKDFVSGREAVIPLHFNCKPINFQALKLQKI